MKVVLALLLHTADGFMIGSKIMAVRGVGSAAGGRGPAVAMAVPYDKTKEGDYPHPHDPDYKFGDITKRMIRDMTGNKDYE